jgi:hypothetical protein
MPPVPSNDCFLPFLLIFFLLFFVFISLLVVVACFKLATTKAREKQKNKNIISRGLSDSRHRLILNLPMLTFANFLPPSVACLLPLLPPLLIF